MSANKRMRRLSIAIAGMAITGWIAAKSILAAPPVAPREDSPIPCSVDGVCIPERDTWGYHATQWRPWPGVGGEPTVAPPPTIPADIPPFVLPSPESEAELAPPPPVSATAPPTATMGEPSPGAPPNDTFNPNIQPLEDNLPPAIPMNPTDLDDLAPPPPEGILTTPESPLPNLLENPAPGLPPDNAPLRPVTPTLPLDTAPLEPFTPASPLDESPLEPSSPTAPLETPTPNSPPPIEFFLPDESTGSDNRPANEVGSPRKATQTPNVGPNPLREMARDSGSADLGPRLAEASAPEWETTATETKTSPEAIGPVAHATLATQQRPNALWPEASRAPEADKWGRQNPLRTEIDLEMDGSSPIQPASHIEPAPPAPFDRPATSTTGRLNPLRGE